MWMWMAVGSVALLAMTVSSAGFEGLQGKFCASRSNACCDGRIDQCSVRVYETLCYCDQFCNRTRADDCCPDYWSFCLGVSEPEPAPVSRCYAGGRYYDYGEEVKINCNKCKCQSTGAVTGVEFVCERKPCLVEEAVINSVNEHRELGWRASNYSFFWGHTLDEGVTFRTGTLEPHKTVKRMQPVMVKDPQTLPRSFDARIKWPGLVGEATDQGWCGASWAVSTAAVASDRFGIMSAGLASVRLSPQHLLSCNKRGQQGCQGGHLSRAWMFIRKFGLVNEECYPWAEGFEQNCRLPRKTTLRTARCRPLPGHPFRTEPYKVGPAYRIQGEHDIMHEIMASGPVQATMKVYQDLFAFNSGVYKKSFAGATNTFGYHSVRIIGWGEDMDAQARPIKYWLAVNSWGPYWGENGLFRILRGSNECEIEEFVLAAWSKAEEPAMISPARPNSESNVLF